MSNTDIPKQEDINWGEEFKDIDFRKNVIDAESWFMSASNTNAKVKWGEPTFFLERTNNLSELGLDVDLHGNLEATEKIGNIFLKVITLIEEEKISEEELNIVKDLAKTRDPDNIIISEAIVNSKKEEWIKKD